MQRVRFKFKKHIWSVSHTFYSLLNNYKLYKKLMFKVLKYSTYVKLNIFIILKYELIKYLSLTMFDKTSWKASD